MAGKDAAKTWRRRSIRLQGYDYAEVGAYFVTICTHGRTCLLGDIADGAMRLNAYGQVVNEEWAYTELARSNVILDAYVVMPNHFHGILLITRHHRGGQASHAASGRLWRSPAQTLGSVMRGFKGATTVRINALRDTPATPVWQRNYYEHVIRDDRELDRIRAYIADNPLRWSEDENNPERQTVRTI